jgi:hypothetical protein
MARLPQMAVKPWDGESGDDRRGDDAPRANGNWKRRERVPDYVPTPQPEPAPSAATPPDSQDNDNSAHTSAQGN